MSSWTTWITLAGRNLLRNKRRSIVTVCAIMLGFAAVNVFGGFTTYMFVNLRDSFVYARGNGHIQVFQEGYRQRGLSDPGQMLIKPETYQMLQDLAEKDPRIILAAGRMELSGTMDTGDANSVFVADAMTPSHRKAFFDSSDTLRHGFSFLTEGNALVDENPNTITISDGVREKMGVDIGGYVALAGFSVDGQMNVVDADIEGIFSSTQAALGDKAIFLPLALAQDLMMTDKVGSVAILVDKLAYVEPVRQLIEEELARTSEDAYEIVTWDQESDMYELTKKMFNMIFGIVFFILIIIVTMSVMNTMGMAIMERITEIGTLRALGLKRNGIVGLFGIEGALLGLVGSLLGFLVTVGVVTVIKLTDPQWTPPTVGSAISLEIRLEPVYLAVTFVFLGVLALVAAILPARRASRMSIVDALGHS